MKVNRGSVLSKEYFLAYLTHVMRVFQCTADEAKVKTVESLFHGDLDVYGGETQRNFLNAYDELTSTC
ncbi:hypothetical protein DES34_101385 [Brevibacillus brevis]|nr:hypothetical protein C7J99_17650 [Brevibacillus brevis]RED35726.1 hypothetical protein DES34_101385 [Brevibacillus brevis]GEC89269.1 hypothetical protein BBR01nite_16000 [Brevibacillus brevis]VEF89163.1 Uncharacterised protein [Brevibacillus brevis]